MPKESASKEIRVISEKLKKYQFEYYVLSKPGISDIEYDRLFDRLLKLENEHPDLSLPDSPTRRVGSDLTQELPEINHRIPVLSLDKFYTTIELNLWIEKNIKIYGKNLSYIIEEKIDGVSVVLYYEKGILTRAVTRGNGVTGNDITGNIKTIGSVPLTLPEKIDAAVRCEVFLPKNYFNEINAKMDINYANPRNLAAGTLRRVKSSKVADVPLDTFAYEGHFDREPESHIGILHKLRELNFKVSRNIRLYSDGDDYQDFIKKNPDWQSGNIKDIDEGIARLKNLRKSLDYEIDGLVIKVNEISARETIGYTSHHPKWAMAFKFESPEGVTQVLNIDVQVGRTGRVTPVARISPVLIAGSTVSNATLHNQEYIDMLELSVGDTVAVSKRGEIIPAVERVVEKNESGNRIWKIPGSCPFCKTPLEKIGAHHFCKNNSCQEQIKGRLHFFASRNNMNIENLGPETLNLLIDKNLISDVYDIYKIDASSLAGLPGMGEKKISLILEGIEKSKTRPYRIILQSLGIPDLGQKAVEIILEAGYKDIDSLLTLADAMDIESLIKIHGIGEKTASTILKELIKPETVNRIENLRKSGLNFSENDSGTNYSGLPKPVFEGQVWCVTGSFTNFKPRDIAIDEIKKRKGAVTSNISSKTTHLLAGENPGGKLEKAKTAGINIVSEKNFMAMIMS